jgi:hypothetical protein
MLVSFYTFTEFHEALNRFTSLYQPELLVECVAASIVRTLKPRAERVCRFCGRRTPDTKFNKQAHIIPELLGNKYLISDFECDACNEHFSTFENDLANFLGAARTVHQVQAKEKVPTFKSLRGEVTVREEDFYGVKDAIKISRDGVENDNFQFDSATGALKIRYTKQPYTPVKVYKALLKIALSVMPEQHMPDYARLLSLLRHDEDNKLAQFAKVGISKVSIRPDYPRCHVAKRISSEVKACTHTFSLYFQDYVFEVTLPLHKADRALESKGSDNIIYACPPLFFEKPDDNLVSECSFRWADFSSDEPVRDQEELILTAPPEAFKNRPVYDTNTNVFTEPPAEEPQFVTIYFTRGDELPTFPTRPFKDV